jgi:hypothetical protein
MVKWQRAFRFVVLFLCGSVAQARIEMRAPFREIQIDPTSLTSEKTYHPGDVVLRARLRRPASTQTLEDRVIDLNGFTVTLPKDTALTEMSFMRTPNPRMFSKADGVGTVSTGMVFCNNDRFALGPFTGDKLSPLKAIACLIDGDQDGVFEAVTFVELYSVEAIGFFVREVGPVPLTPLAYQPVPGQFVPEERVDLVFQRFSGKDLYLKPLLFDKSGKHGSIRMYTDERRTVLTNYERGCLVNAQTGSVSPSSLLGVEMVVSNSDPIGLSFTASLAKANAEPSFAYVSSHQSDGEFLPQMMARCGER